MDPDKKENFFTDLGKTTNKTKLIINDELGLIWEGTCKDYDDDYIEDRHHILNSEILDYKYDEKNNVFETLIDYGSLE